MRVELTDEELDILHERAVDIVDEWFEIVRQYNKKEITFQEFDAKAMQLTFRAAKNNLPFIANMSDIRMLLSGTKKIQ